MEYIQVKKIYIKLIVDLLVFRIESYEECQYRGTRKIEYKQKAELITDDYINIAWTELCLK